MQTSRVTEDCVNIILKAIFDGKKKSYRYWYVLIRSLKRMGEKNLPQFNSILVKKKI